MTQKHIGAILCAVWLVCAALLLNGAVVRIPPARPSAVRVQAAWVASTGTGTAVNYRPAMPSGAIIYLADAPTYWTATGAGDSGYWTDPDTGNTASQAVDVTLKPDLVGRGLDFSSRVANRLKVTSLNSLPVPFTLTFCASLKNSAAVNYYYIFDGSANMPGIMSRTTVGFSTYNGGWLGEPATTWGDAAGSTRVYSICSDAASQWMYRNGSLVNSASNPLTIGTAATLGNYNSGSSAWNGSIYAFVAHNRVLTSAECASVSAALLAVYP